ncbi:hypothetical protein [Streptomyces sp. NPDC048411]|uniref:hypothetical protein n=1 Tax=Streptomyces sp. NPDC048411 TaxID=3157206 RepID=UPI003451E9BB
MKLYLVVPVVLLAVLIPASGGAGVSRCWVLPANWRPVRGEGADLLLLLWKMQPPRREWSSGDEAVATSFLRFLILGLT